MSGTRVDDPVLARRRLAPRLAVRVALLLCGLLPTAGFAQDDTDVEPSGSAGSASVGFAVFASATTPDGAPDTASLLRAVGDGDARFVVQFDASASPKPASVAAPADQSCTDDALERRRAVLDASAKPLVPIPATTEWADCGTNGNDPFERLQRVDDAFFAGDQSLGQERLTWVRQSATPRFRRYRENVRWQIGRVVFATINLPDNNNDFRIGAGRNGEFEERLVANRAWLQRTFRLATERKLPMVVLFVDADPRWSTPWRAPDLRSRERDGYYEWKAELREAVAAFAGKVLLVQGHGPDATSDPPVADHPLHDANGRPMTSLTRVVAPPTAGDARWLRVSIEAGHSAAFRLTLQRVFDDPSGELYGPSRVK